MPPFSADKTYALFSSESNHELIADLERTGARHILFPRIEVLSVIDDSHASTLHDLAGFAWVVFTDVYCVDFFIGLLSASGIDPFILDELKVYAIGDAVADRLRSFKLHADLVTDNLDVSLMVSYSPDDFESENLKVMILLEQDAVLAIQTQATGCKTEFIEFRVYSSHFDSAGLAKVKSLLKGGAIDEFILTSPSDVMNIAHIFHADYLTDVLAGIVLTTTDGATLLALKDFRLA